MLVACLLAMGEDRATPASEAPAMQDATFILDSDNRER